MFCPNCGSEIPAGGVVCGRCSPPSFNQSNQYSYTNSIQQPEDGNIHLKKVFYISIGVLLLTILIAVINPVIGSEKSIFFGKMYDVTLMSEYAGIPIIIGIFSALTAIISGVMFLTSKK